MEFNARYVLTGIFSLFVIAAAFAFVYWLNNAGGFGARSNYQVRFSIPVSGIATGGNVLFNGVRVGEITKLSYDNEKPSELVADISIDRDTPVRQDTKAGIDYQGLTGAANILLTGGAPDAPELIADKNSIPELIADPTDTRSWTQNAGRVLQRVDDMFGENKGRVDTILTGLERMTGSGGDEASNQKFDLKVPEFVGQLAKTTGWKLAISEPVILLALNTDKIQQELENSALASYDDLRWTDNLPNLFQSKIIRSFEDAGFANSVLRPDDVLDADYQLILDIRKFHYRQFGAKAIVIDMVAKIMDAEGAVLKSHRFQSQYLVTSDDQVTVIAAFNTLFSRAVKELVEWSENVI